MNVQQQNQQKGFTIIEVILVLAIAGLIFLMVFLALPALQRGQRDTQRKTDLSRVLTAVQNYQSNNRNNVPQTNALSSFTSNYLRTGGDNFEDPNGTAYTLVNRTATASPTGDAGDGRIFYTAGATCGADGAVTSGQGSKKVAVRMILEGGGVACESN